MLAMNTLSRWSVLTLKCKAIASTVVHRPYHQFKLTDYETCELILCALTVTEPELTGLDAKSGFFVKQQLNSKHNFLFTVPSSLSLTRKKKVSKCAFLV